ncbi:MAG TPA: glycosyltransferase [Labilithrix sp.]|nr:glycosyltransferase [Labilithrix sp.]
MRILFVGYWAASDPLTSATVVPHLRILAEFPSVREIVLATIERDPSQAMTLELPKVKHVHLLSRPTRLNLATRARDALLFPRVLSKLARAGGQARWDAVFARSTQAGALALEAARSSTAPLFVESYEPHADYAVDAGAWSPSGLRATYLRLKMRTIEREAAALMPVTRWYGDVLAARGVPRKRIRVMPCAVDCARFAFSPSDRQRTRENLGLIGSGPVGIYVGKFGGLYYDKEVFQIVRRCFDRFPSFEFIFLSPMAAEVAQRCRAAGIDTSRVRAMSVRHDEVPAYLSAADFALTPVAPAPSKRAQGTVKNAEYWANGLPVLMTDGVGDEATFLEAERAGAVFDLQKGTLDAAIDKIAALLADEGHRTRIVTLAQRERSFDVVRDIYRSLLDELDGAARPLSACA